MKHLKLVIVLSAVVGLVEIALPAGHGSLLQQVFAVDPLEAVIYAAIFALPLVMGLTALFRPPLQAWQGGVALAGFVLGVVRFRVWDTVAQLGSSDVPILLRSAAIVVGTVASVVALMRPESQA